MKDLLKVKSIVTLLMIVTMCGLCVMSKIDSDVFSALCGSIITYYFTRKDDTTNGSNN